MNEKNEVEELNNFTTADSQQLTDWVNEPSIGDLDEDLRSSKSYQSTNAGKIRNWQNALNVEGSHKPPKVKGRSSIQPKLVRRQAEWRYPALSEPFLSSNKLFQVNPATFEDKKAAEQNELVLNHQFRTKVNRVKFIDEYVRTAVNEGTVIVQVGWERVTEPATEVVPVFEHYPVNPEDEETVNTINEANEIYLNDPRGFDEFFDEATKAAVIHLNETGEYTVAMQSGEEEIEYDEVLENRPTIEILDAENVYIDPSCNGDIDKALFVIRSFEVNLADLQKEGDKYKNLDNINWNTVDATSDGEHVSNTPSDFSFKDTTRRKAVAYEYWGFYDIHDNGSLTPIVATWIGNTMIRMEENPYPDEKLPFEIVTYLPVTREVYGEPDAELLQDNQRVLGAITRGMIDLLGKSANSQQGHAKGFLDPLNRRRYESGQDYEFNPSSSPQAGHIQHTYPEIPNSALTMLGIQNQEAEALTGVKAFSGGISGESYGKVATGIRGALDAAGKREMSILRRLAEGLKRIGTKIVAMNAVFLSEEETVRITNMHFVQIKREDLKGNFDLQVDISTAEVDEAKSQDLGFMLQTIGPNMDPTLNMKILSEIAKLKRMPELANDLANWKPEPDPFEEQLKQLKVEEQQLKNALLEAEIELIRAKVMGEEVDFTKTEVDLQEKVSGIKHLQDMERIQSQAEANQRHEITKALARSRKIDDIPGDIDAAIGYNRLAKDLDGPKELE